MADFKTDIMQAISETFREYLIINAKAFGLDHSEVIKNTKITINKEGLLITYPGYLKYIESGRKVGSGKGTRLPILVLIKWMKKKNIAPGKENKIAWAIQQTIYKRGIKNGVKPRPFLENTIDNTEKELVELLSVSFKDLVEQKILAKI